MDHIAEMVGRIVEMVDHIAFEVQVDRNDLMAQMVDHSDRLEFLVGLVIVQSKQMLLPEI